MLIPKLKLSGTLVGVFPSPNNDGVVLELDQLEKLENDLREELAKME